MWPAGTNRIMLNPCITTYPHANLSSETPNHVRTHTMTNTHVLLTLLRWQGSRVLKAMIKVVYHEPKDESICGHFRCSSDARLRRLMRKCVAFFHQATASINRNNTIMNSRFLNIRNTAGVGVQGPSVQAIYLVRFFALFLSFFFFLLSL